MNVCCSGNEMEVSRNSGVGAAPARRFVYTPGLYKLPSRQPSIDG